MMPSMLASKWRHKVEVDRAATMAVEAVMAEGKVIRLVEVIHLAIRVQIRISLSKGNRWWCKYSNKAVARRATDTTMVTWLWCEPGIRHMTMEWRQDCDLGHWIRMISA